MRALRHSLLLLLAIPVIALLTFAAGPARAADPASVVSKVEAANLPATTADPPAATPSTGADISGPASSDTSDTSSAHNVQNTVQTTDQSDPTAAAPTSTASPAPPAAPAPPTPPAPPVPSAPATPPASPTTTTPVPVANATTQVVSQMQVSGCLSHCHGASQTQVASQQNRTVQSVTGNPHPVPVSTPPPGPSSSRIKQVQIGCVSDCFGATSTGTAHLGPHELSQLMQALGAANSHPATPVTGVVQNTVSQTSGQTQSGAAGPDSQVQSANQASLTIQALPADLVFNSTTQAIAQIQIGCLFYCYGTSQYQLASQSNTTVEVSPSAAAMSTATASSVVNLTEQLIWQLQIGCLMWCWDSSQSQSASSNDVLVELPAPPPPPPAQPLDPVQPSDPGPSSPTEAAPSAPAAPPGVAGPPPPPVPMPSLTPAAAVAVSPAAIGSSASAPLRSALQAERVVSGSFSSSAWLETVTATGWSVTLTASPAESSSVAPLASAPAFSQASAPVVLPASASAVSPAWTASFSRQTTTSSISRRAGSSHNALRRHASHPSRGTTETPGTAAIDEGADRVLAIGLAAIALIGLLAGVVAWRRRIG